MFLCIRRDHHATGVVTVLLRQRVLAILVPTHVWELALGLELSGQRFLCVVRSPSDEGTVNDNYYDAESKEDPLRLPPKGLRGADQRRGARSAVVGAVDQGAGARGHGRVPHPVSLELRAQEPCLWHAHGGVAALHGAEAKCRDALRRCRRHAPGARVQREAQDRGHGAGGDAEGREGRRCQGQGGRAAEGHHRGPPRRGRRCRRAGRGDGGVDDDKWRRGGLLFYVMMLSSPPMPCLWITTVYFGPYVCLCRVFLKLWFPCLRDLGVYQSIYSILPIYDYIYIIL